MSAPTVSSAPASTAASTTIPPQVAHELAGMVLAKSAPSNRSTPEPRLSRAGVEHVIVAIHGIGDQVRNDTVLATAIRFCERYGYPGLLSLGAFQPAPGETPGLMVYEPPRIEGFWGKMAFAEAHWADVARAVVKEGYTLQETKAWARTIVNRVRVLATRRDPGNASLDYHRIRLVLEEIIEALGVIETLLFLSKKAGLGEFNLKEVLDDFIGDVQLVTEFATVRTEILSRFVNTMADVSAKFPHAKLHVVAHSEGTVVALLGLLEACDHLDDHLWIHRVHGFMTLGSPIDKHLILWPALFQHHERPSDKVQNAIRWVNYTDYGDPIGYTLDTARDWLRQRGYHRVLQFSPQEDFCFRRYPIPGKAHVDYWRDPEVFGDFIQRVVHPEIVNRPADPARVDGPPRNRAWIPLVSHGLGYLLPLAVIHLAAYVLVSAIAGYYDPKDEGEHPNFVPTVLGLAWLIAGTTVWLRLMRLTRTWPWVALGFVLYALAVSGYLWALGQMDLAAPIDEFAWLERVPLIAGLPIGATCLAGSIITIAVVLARAPQWKRRQAPAPRPTTNDDPMTGGTGRDELQRAPASTGTNPQLATSR